MQKKFKEKSRNFRLFLLIATLIFLFGVLFTLYANISILAFSKPYLYDLDEINMEEENYDTILILGARVYSSGMPCPMLQDRLDTGVSLFNRSFSGTILLSGDHGKKDYDEVNGMKQYVFRQGMKKENVFLDHAGFSTYESMYRAKAVFEVKSALIVTQKFHLARAVYIARKMGIEAYGIHSDRRVYPVSELRRLNVREYLARVKDFLLVNLLKPRPAYLGNVIPIDGNSDDTYDYID